MTSRMITSVIGTLALSLALAALPRSASAQPVTTAFSYQGQLRSAGAPAEGAFDLRFRIYDDATAGTQVGPVLCADNVSVVDGVFTVALDFGAQFSGQRRWLELEVRSDTGGGCGVATGYTVLAPRQEITAAPHATFATNSERATSASNATNATQLNGQPAGYYQDASNLNAGTLGSGRLSGSYSGVVAFSNPANAFTGSGVGLSSVNAAQLGGQAAAFYLNASNLNAGTLADGRLSPNVATLAGAQTFTGAKVFSSASNAFSGSGSGLTGVNASQLGGQAGSFYQNAANLNAGTLPDARLSAGVALLSGAQVFSGTKTFSAAPSFTAAGSPFTVTGTAVVTNLNADLLDGQSSSAFAGATHTHTAADVNAGTLNDARLSTNIPRLTATVNDFTSINNFTSTFNTFTGSGLGLTQLSASNVSTGTLSDSRLSANIPKLNTSNTFSGGGNTFTGNVVVNGGFTLSSTTPNIQLTNGTSSATARLNSLSEFEVQLAGVRKFSVNSGRAEVTAIDATLNLNNLNDGGLGFIVNTWESLQFGLSNRRNEQWGQVPPLGTRVFFGFHRDGVVGTMTNSIGEGLFRNYLDDGTGTARFHRNVFVDNASAFDGVFTTPGRLAFGGLTSREGIGSTRYGTGPNPFGLDVFTAGAARLSVTADGFVGIGTRTPRAALEVNGDIRVGTKVAFPDGTIQETGLPRGSAHNQVLVWNANADRWEAVTLQAGGTVPSIPPPPPPGAPQQTFVANGQFTVPAGVTQVRVEAWGGGGNGGAGDPTAPPANLFFSLDTSSKHGGGGGGGAYSYAIVPVTPGELLAVTVGGPGQASRVSRGVTNLVVANGGTNGESGASGGAAGVGGAADPGSTHSTRGNDGENAWPAAFAPGGWPIFSAFDGETGGQGGRGGLGARTQTTSSMSVHTVPVNPNQPFGETKEVYLPVTVSQSWPSESGSPGGSGKCRITW